MNGCFQANILAVKAIGPRLINLAYILGPYLMVWVLSLSSTDLSTHGLTPEYMSVAFGVHLDLVGFDSP